MRTAWRIVENTSTNLFLTGRAGTGKTTFLKQLRMHSSKRMVVLAPTGIAAINAGGMTIHSFFQLALAPYVPGAIQQGERRRYDRFSREKLRIIKTLDLLVIDEVSMVRADLLDAVDAALRRHRNPELPFGGVQLLLIGDLQQLAPVVKADEWELLSQYYATPYFFSSKALNTISYHTVELEHVYRQSDTHFLNLLNMVRENRADSSVLATLNSRYIPNFAPSTDDGYIRLTTHNNQARKINEAELNKLPSEAHTFEATINGDFPEQSYPTNQTLVLKVGAQIMFLRNDPARHIYNGMMGHVVDITPENEVIVRPIGTDMRNIAVEPATWENSRYTLNKDSGEIEEEIQGTFTQLPLRLAWAITIHKSQGLTFEKAIIDTSASFAHGQTYVALSRCKTLEGMVLSSPITANAIINDTSVSRFTASHCTGLPSEEQLTALQNEYFVACLDELFNIDSLARAFDALRRVLDEFLHTTYPVLCDRYAELAPLLHDELEKVSSAFARHYHCQAPQSAELRQRIAGGCAYFRDKFQPLVALLADTPTEADNKTVKIRLEAARTDLHDRLFIRLKLLEKYAVEPFAVDTFSAAKAQAILALEKGEKMTKKEATVGATGDILNPQLYAALTAWRLEKAKSINRPAFVVFGNRVLIAIANTCPLTPDELLAVPGVGKAKLETYGEEILQITKNHSLTIH